MEQKDHPEFDPERDDGPEGAKDILADIRCAILADTKAMGRRLTVDEALARYGDYGVEASEVIAAMAEQGLLSRSSPPGGPRAPAAPASPFSTPFDAEAFGRNIGAAVHGFVEEIERSVERSKRGEPYAGTYARHIARHVRRAERHAMRAALRDELGDSETGKWDRKLMEDEEWKPGREELAHDFAAYREGLETRCRKRRSGLVGNLVSFLCVNGFLWYINLTTSGGFLWAAIVSAAWGIGVVSSIVSASRAGATLREIDALPDLDRGQLAMYKKLTRMKDSMAQHAASTVMVPLFLGVINFLASPTVPWSLIPAAAMLIGFVSHLAAYAGSKPRLERTFLESLGVAGGWRSLFRRGRTRRADEAGLGSYAGLYREAEEAERAIVEQLRSGASGPVDADLGPSLEQYLGQVRLLARSANEVERIVEAIPMEGLEKDKAALVAKEASASSEQLKAEYRASIAEIEKQEHSYRDLKEQSEMLRLRLGSSVNQLKRMRIDIARLRAAPGADGLAAGQGLEQIRQRTDELSHYLEDLRQGYAESAADPFAALEELEARGRLPAGGAGDGPEAGPDGPASKG